MVFANCRIKVDQMGTAAPKARRKSGLLPRYLSLGISSIPEQALFVPF